MLCFDDVIAFNQKATVLLTALGKDKTDEAALHSVRRLFHLEYSQSSSSSTEETHGCTPATRSTLYTLLLCALLTTPNDDDDDDGDDADDRSDGGGSTSDWGEGNEMKQLHSQKLLLMIDDAQYGDPASWSLLRRLRQEKAAATSLVLVCASRSSIPVADATFVELQPFTHGESLQLIKLELEVDIVAPGLAELALDRGQGIPHYIVELVLLLRQEGVLRFSVAEREEGPEEGPDTIGAAAGGAGGGAGGAGAGAMQSVCELAPSSNSLAVLLPTSIQGIVLAQIDALTPLEQLTVKCAAIFGRTFAIDQVAGILPFGNRSSSTIRTSASTRRTSISNDVHRHPAVLDLSVVVHRLCRKGVFVPADSLGKESKFRFQQTMVQETASLLWPAEQQRQMHARAAACIERHAGYCHPSALHHWRAAGEVRRLAESLLSAGNAALDSHLLKEARDCFEEAVHLLRSTSNHAGTGSAGGAAAATKCTKHRGGKLYLLARTSAANRRRLHHHDDERYCCVAESVRNDELRLELELAVMTVQLLQLDAAAAAAHAARAFQILGVPQKWLRTNPSSPPCPASSTSTTFRQRAQQWAHLRWPKLCSSRIKRTEPSLGSEFLVETYCGVVAAQLLSAPFHATGWISMELLNKAESTFASTAVLVKAYVLAMLHSQQNGKLERAVRYKEASSTHAALMKHEEQRFTTAGWRLAQHEQAKCTWFLGLMQFEFGCGNIAALRAIVASAQTVSWTAAPGSEVQILIVASSMLSFLGHADDAEVLCSAAQILAASGSGSTAAGQPSLANNNDGAGSTAAVAWLPDVLAARELSVQHGSSNAKSKDGGRGCGGASKSGGNSKAPLAYSGVWQSELHHAASALHAAKRGEVFKAWKHLGNMEEGWMPSKANALEGLSVATKAEVLLELLRRTRAPGIHPVLDKQLLDLRRVARVYPVFAPRMLNLAAENLALKEDADPATRRAAAEALKVAVEMGEVGDQDRAGRTARMLGISTLSVNTTLHD